MTSPNELAASAKLSRKTCSVTRDSKRDQIIVVEQVSETTVGDQAELLPRTDTYYYIYEDVATTEINAILQECKDRATLSFLGLDMATGIVGNVPEVEAGKASPKEEPVAKKKSVPRKKKATKKAAEPTPEPVAEEEDDLLGDDEPITILYDKANREHAGFLRPIVMEAFGADWKADKETQGKVRSLIAKLNGKVEVSDVEGNLLPKFVETAKAMIA